MVTAVENLDNMDVREVRLHVVLEAVLTGGVVDVAEGALSDDDVTRTVHEWAHVLGRGGSERGRVGVEADRSRGPVRAPSTLREREPLGFGLLHRPLETVWISCDHRHALEVGVRQR